MFISHLGDSGTWGPSVFLSRGGVYIQTVFVCGVFHSGFMVSVGGIGTDGSEAGFQNKDICFKMFAVRRVEFIW